MVLPFPSPVPFPEGALCPGTPFLSTYEALSDFAFSICVNEKPGLLIFFFFLPLFQDSFFFLESDESPPGSLSKACFSCDFLAGLLGAN